MTPAASGFKDHHEHVITSSVRGWLESPTAGAVVVDYVLVAGWAFGTNSRIASIEVRGLGPPQTTLWNIKRQDVKAVYTDEAGALFSGFSAWIELDTVDAAERRVEVWATFEDGAVLRLFDRHIFSRQPERLFARGLASVARSIAFAVRRAVTDPAVPFQRLWALGDGLLRHRAAVTGANLDRAGEEFHSHDSDDQTARAFLTAFLATDSRLAVPAAVAPTVSVIIVAWNRADLVLKCVRAVAEQTTVKIETIVVDNGSTDDTPALLGRLDGLKVITNPRNHGFTVAANLGARGAKGEFLLFLNSDTELLPGAVDALVSAARASDRVGAVGGKLVFPSGRLQEAGAIIWSDGSCESYGRDGNPTAPEFGFLRDVDYCSGALLLTPRTVFEHLGGFDERYRPAYYEDADYCVRLWSRGYTVVYQPRAVALHLEFGSAVSRAASVDLQRSRRDIFTTAHGDWLARQRSRSSLLQARSHPHGSPGLVCIDDAAPEPSKGAGFPRAAALLGAFRDLGYGVTVYTTNQCDNAPRPRGIPPWLEVVPGSPDGLRDFLRARNPDLVLVSRPHNMRYLKMAVGKSLQGLGAACIYDAEAMYSLREIQRRKIANAPIFDAEARALIDEELGLARGARTILTVSRSESAMFAAAGIGDVFLVTHAAPRQAGARPFEDRHSILFVGALAADSPNEDALRFFHREVVPALAGSPACHAPVVVCGAGADAFEDALIAAGIECHSDPADLTPYYDDARVFVAPTRYAAGISLKVIEAAARGVPVVCTSVIGEQLGWRVGTEILTADTPDAFASAIGALYSDPVLWRQVRDAALARIGVEYDPAVFRRAVENALAATLHHRRAPHADLVTE